MIGIISFAVLVAAVVLGRAAARKMSGGGGGRGFIGRRGVAETLALVLVAGISFPLAGLIDFLLSGDMNTLGVTGWIVMAVVLVAGVAGWILAGRIPKAGAAKAA